MNFIFLLSRFIHLNRWNVWRRNAYFIQNHLDYGEMETSAQKKKIGTWIWTFSIFFVTSAQQFNSLFLSYMNIHVYLDDRRTQSKPSWHQIYFIPFINFSLSLFLEEKKEFYYFCKCCKATTCHTEWSKIHIEMWSFMAQHGCSS